MEAVERAVRTFIEENYVVGQGAELSGDESLMDQGIIDSTGVLELVAFLEDEFGLTVADEELVPENLDTVSNIVGFVQRKVG